MSTTTSPEHLPGHAPPSAVPAPPADDAPRQSLAARLWHWLWGVVPTALVIAALGGLAVWGHNNDWQLPTFAGLTGAGDPPHVAWCEEHGVPEAQCVECNPGLLPRGADYGWCSVHGVHDCPLEHPDVAQTKEAPEVSAADFHRAAAALALVDRKPNNSVCTSYRRRIQFASFEAVAKAGLDVAVVDRHPIVEAIVGNGEITYDATRFANVSSRVAGTVWQVQKDIGDRVQAGEVLALVDGKTVGEAKGELVDALVEEGLQLRTLDRLQGIGDGVIAGRRIIETQAAYDEARVHVLAAQQSLSNLGFVVNLDQLRALSHEEQIDRLRRLGVGSLDERANGGGPSTANLLPIRSVMDGVVVTRNVVAGEVVDTSQVLFQVADTGQMWVKVNVPLEDADQLKLGLPVRFRPDGSREEVTGKLTWISSAVDPQTRMVETHAELPNPAGRLRDGTFGTGRIVLRDEPEAIVVPDDAIQSDGDCQLVFVRDTHYFDSPQSPKLFHVRTVRVGARTDDGLTEIIAGVLPGEIVATMGSDILRAQLLKSNLGEGCGCAD